MPAPAHDRPRGVRRRDVLATAAAAAVAAGVPAGAAQAATRPSFTPRSLVGCDGWFDAASLAAGPTAAPLLLRTAIPVPVLLNRAGSGAAAAAVNAPTLAPSASTGQQQLRFTGREVLVTPLADDPVVATHVAVIEQSAFAAGAILGTAEGGGDNGFELRVNADGTVTGARSGVWEIGTSSRRIPLGRPTIVAFQFDSNGIWACYIDGQAAGVGRTEFHLTAGTRLAIGASAGSSTPPFSGSIAEIVRYRRALPGHELRLLHRYLATKWRVPVAQPVAAAGAVPGLSGLVGSNIAPKLSQYAGGSVWTSFWADWDLDWVNACIDTAQAAGSNAVRTIGDVQAVASGRISQGQYLDRVQQVIDACADRGMRYYPCGFSLQAIGSASAASVATQLQEQARLLAASPTVVGFDLINELATNYAASGQERAVELALALATSVRRAAPHLPITVSDIGDLQWGALSRGTPLPLYRRFAASVDFFDIHVYAPPADLRRWQLAPYELTVDRPLVIGEFGLDAARYGEQAAADYYAMVRLLVSTTPAVKGVFQWAAIDDAFGLRTETGATPRPLVAAEWARFRGLFA